TTEYVLVETGNWLAGAGDRSSFVILLDALNANPQTTIVDASRELFAEGLQLFRERRDKDWGLTHFISFALMHLMGNPDALTADRHFEQAGFRALLLHLS